jgi:hypothetical protein
MRTRTISTGPPNASRSGKDFEFDTEVKSVIWDETARLWEVQAVGLDGPRTW